MSTNLPKVPSTNDPQERSMSTDLPEIRLTKRDFARLDHLLATWTGGLLSKAADFLLQEITRARIAAEVPPGTVTMHSQVLFRDDESGRKRTVTIVYPSERNSGADALSILTPLGAALIGLAEGQSISFEGLDGNTRSVTVLKVFGQPDQTGD